MKAARLLKNRIAFRRNWSVIDATGLTPTQVNTHLEAYALARSTGKRDTALKVALEACQRFELVARASNDALWDWNLITNTIWWSVGFENLFGYPLEELEPT